MYNGSLLTGVDKNGAFQTEELNAGIIWYFLNGVVHNVQDLEDKNKYLLTFLLMVILRNQVCPFILIYLIH